MTWIFVEYYKGVRIYKTEYIAKAFKIRGKTVERFKAASNVRSTLEQARRYVDQLEQEGFLTIHQK